MEARKLLLIMLSFMLGIKTLTAQITVGTTAKTFQSVNPKKNEDAYQGKTENDMKFVQFSELFTLSRVQGGSREGGIYATNVGANGLVTVSMYLYDEASPDGKGTKIWGCYSDRNSTSATDFVHKAHQLTITDKLTQTPVSIDETDIVRILQVSDAYKTGTCSEWVTTTESIRPNMLMSGLYGAYRVCRDAIKKDYIRGTLACILGGEVLGFIQGDDTPTKKEITTKQDYDCASRYLGLRNVIIELTVQNATVNAVKVPILGQIDLNQTFGVSTPTIAVIVKVNGTERCTIPSSQTTVPVLDIQMGDQVSLEVNTTENLQPTIAGVPDVWVAAFAEDVQFICTPNKQPGAYKPFIGFDTYIHQLQLRPYPAGFQTQETAWEYTAPATGTSLYTYKWSWMASREMEASKTNYTATYTWPKWRLANDGTTHQRQHKKEGLNLELLTRFSYWPINDFKRYDGKGNFHFEVDDDELIYLGTKDPETTTTHPSNISGNPPIIKQNTFAWKTMPEGEDKTYNSITGYPEDGWPLNIMVDAYLRAKSTNYKAKYNGYEIQDANTDNTRPYGTGANNKAPGKILVNVGATQVAFKLNVTSAFDNTKGFYQRISGPDNPALGEQGVQYTIVGLPANLTATEQAKYSIGYCTIDYDGNYTETAYQGYPSVSINMNANAYYSWLVLYYKRDATSEKVTVGGKVLRPIALSYCGIKKKNTADANIPEGKGVQARAFQEDFRTSSYGDYTQQTGSKYYSKYVKTYILLAGDQVTFNTWDGDPHRFANTDQDYDQSSHALAARVPDSYLDGSYSLNNGVYNSSYAYLKYFIGTQGGTLSEVTTNRSGKDLTYTFSTAGTYEVKVSYRNTSELYVLVKVVAAYPNGSYAKIKKRRLTSKEISWLGLSSTLANNVYAAEVYDFTSEYLFRIGSRASAPSYGGVSLPQRWAKYNDYRDEYIWTMTKTDGTNGIESVDSDNEFILKLAISSYLNSYDNNVRKAWFPSNWILHFPTSWLQLPNGLPTYVANSDVLSTDQLQNISTTNRTSYENYLYTNLFVNLYKPWQYYFSWPAYTTYWGYRVRQLGKCIFDLSKVFDPTNGAFSGNPFPKGPTTSVTYTDDYKDQQEFYLALKYGRISIYIDSGNKFKNFQVNNAGGELVVARTTISQIPARVAVAENEEPSVQVFPNPTKGLVHIHFGRLEQQDVLVNVINLSGQVVFQKAVNTSGNVSVDLAHLPSSQYIVKLVAGNWQHAQSIIIQK